MEDEPDSWMCPVFVAIPEPTMIGGVKNVPCLEVLTEVTCLSDRELKGVCSLHGTFRWGLVGGWVR